MGHVITTASKIRIVKDFLRSRSAKNIKQFLSLTEYYKYFIPSFSTISKLLTNIFKKNREEIQKTAFIHLVNLLRQESLL